MILYLPATDGGRIALALVGRDARPLTGSFFLIALLAAGVVGSDLFLFYFAFVVAFQTGNEIPARNEVDSISFPRVLLAIFAYSISFLTLVPFQ